MKSSVFPAASKLRLSARNHWEETPQLQSLLLQKKAVWVSEPSRAALTSPLKGQNVQGQSYPPTSREH